MESGNFSPDIMLLAPIARLLNITLDELLSFHREFTVEEIKNFVYEADAKLKEVPYEEAFQWAKERLEQYPNCEQLILAIAVIFDAQRVVKNIVDSEKYDSHISHCYVCALESDDKDIRNRAVHALFAFYLRKERYEKAEEYLNYLSKQNLERKRKQAVIYSKINRRDEAYKAYEELLFSQYQMISMVFHSIYVMAMEDHDIQKAHMLVEKQSELAKVFEMGKYRETACRLDLATAEKNVESTIEIMGKLIFSIEKIDDFRKSYLYEHMSFKETR